MSPPRKQHLSSEGEDYDFSSNPSSPEELLSVMKPVGNRKSPLALFAIAAGMFLINPGNFDTTTTDHGSTKHFHSHLERSFIEPTMPSSSSKPTSSSTSSFYVFLFPIIAALLVNLAVFLYIFGGGNGKKKKYYNANKQLLILKQQTSHGCCITKSHCEKRRKELESLLSQFDRMPKNWITKCIYTIVGGFKLPFTLMKKKRTSSFSPSLSPVIKSIKEEISKLYIEYGKLSGSNLFAAIRALNYSCSEIDDDEGSNDDIVIAGLILSKSKLLLQLVLLFRPMKNHVLCAATNRIEFFKKNIGSSFYQKVSHNEIGFATVTPTTTSNIGQQEIRSTSSCNSNNNSNTNCISINDTYDEVNQLVCKFKEEMMSTGITELFYNGDGREYFKSALEVALKGRDKVCQFWGAVTWAEAEFTNNGGN